MSFGCCENDDKKLVILIVLASKYLIVLIDRLVWQKRNSGQYILYKYHEDSDSKKLVASIILVAKWTSFKVFSEYVSAGWAIN